MAGDQIAPIRKLFSICIPAFNRARHLAPLLDSVFDQAFDNFEVVVCEDVSPERAQIASIVGQYQAKYPGVIHYYENPANLGYDGNIRELVKRARGRFCFFMGNDDLLCADALSRVAEILARHSNVGFVLRGYAWFDETPDRIAQSVRYFDEEKEFSVGAEAISVCFRRSGVISGYIVDRDAAHNAATSRFDGTLYYQLYLTASVLRDKKAVATPEVLVLCRNSEPPDFGHSNTEKGRYKPGSYTPEARINMVSGALAIIKDLRDTFGIDLVDDVMRDYAHYFYAYIRDQLSLPFNLYYRLYRTFGQLGFDRYQTFHVYCVAGYLLGQHGCDALIKTVRGFLGSSPRWGAAR
jgi:abequosyltransferase